MENKMMQNEIKIINLPLPFWMGSVNCYLIQAGAGRLLIDTGSSNNRQALVRELERAGCQPGSLRLIALTHGDFDHTGNAAYLRQAYGGKIAMHPGDAGMAERGDMFEGRKKPNRLIRALLPVFSGFGKSKWFKPDLLLEDGQDLSEYGLDARVISIPGHSLGSIAILTASGDCFCGDLLENRKEPTLNSLIDDPVAARASLQKLRSMGASVIYPGHGRPFALELFQLAS